MTTWRKRRERWSRKERVSVSRRSALVLLLRFEVPLHLGDLLEDDAQRPAALDDPLVDGPVLAERLLHLGIVAEPGEGDDAQRVPPALGLEAADLGRRLDAVHAGHLNVAEEEREGALGGEEELERLLAVLGGGKGDLLAREELDEDVAGDRVVLCDARVSRVSSSVERREEEEREDAPATSTRTCLRRGTGVGDSSSGGDGRRGSFIGTTLRNLSPTPLRLSLAASTARSSSSARALTWRRGSSGRRIDGRRGLYGAPSGAEDGDGDGDSSEACIADTAFSKSSSSIGEPALLKPAGAARPLEPLDCVVERCRPEMRGADCEADAELEVAAALGPLDSS